MEITKDLIQRFLENRCNPEEFEAVTRWLEAHPADAVRLLGWEDVDAARPVDDHDPEDVLGQLRERLFPKRRGVIGRLIWASAAALVLLVAGLRVWVKPRQNAAKMAEVEIRQRARWIERRNSGDRALIIALPDSSTLKLYGHSSVRYTDSFGLVRRDSWVEGEADFAVRKDKQHPFTVYSGLLATTALGTSFGVKGGTDVRLYTGRVVVHNLSGGKDIFLRPGERLSYDAVKGLAAVNRFVPAPTVASVGIKELSFNNSPLKKVFRRLSAHYHTKIDYRAADLAGMNFTGDMNSTDSLSTILRLLGTMNSLDVKEAPTGFVVRKARE